MFYLDNSKDPTNPIGYKGKGVPDGVGALPSLWPGPWGQELRLRLTDDLTANAWMKAISTCLPKATEKLDIVVSRRVDPQTLLPLPMVEDSEGASIWVTLPDVDDSPEALAWAGEVLQHLQPREGMVWSIYLPSSQLSTWGVENLLTSLGTLGVRCAGRVIVSSAIVPRVDMPLLYSLSQQHLQAPLGLCLYGNDQSWKLVSPLHFWWTDDDANKPTSVAPRSDLDGSNKAPKNSYTDSHTGDKSSKIICLDTNVNIKNTKPPSTNSPDDELNCMYPSTGSLASNKSTRTLCENFKVSDKSSKPAYKVTKTNTNSSDIPNVVNDGSANTSNKHCSNLIPIDKHSKISYSKPILNRNTTKNAIDNNQDTHIIDSTATNKSSNTSNDNSNAPYTTNDARDTHSKYPCSFPVTIDKINAPNIVHVVTPDRNANVSEESITSFCRDPDTSQKNFKTPCADPDASEKNTKTPCINTNINEKHLGPNIREMNVTNPCTDSNISENSSTTPCADNISSYKNSTTPFTEYYASNNGSHTTCLDPYSSDKTSETPHTYPYIYDKSSKFPCTYPISSDKSLNTPLTDASTCDNSTETSCTDLNIIDKSLQISYIDLTNNETNPMTPYTDHTTCENRSMTKCADNINYASKLVIPCADANTSCKSSNTHFTGLFASDESLGTPYIDTNVSKDNSNNFCDVNTCNSSTSLAPPSDQYVKEQSFETHGSDLNVSNESFKPPWTDPNQISQNYRSSCTLFIVSDES